MIWLHLLFALVLNAIPAWGVFALGWSVGVLLILFWLENLAGVLLIGVRLHLHQKRSNDPLYRNLAAAPRMSVNGKEVRFVSHARGFLAMALPFALAHGIFAIALPWAFAQQDSGANAALWAPRWVDVKLGAGLLGLAMLCDLLVDLRCLARWPAAAVKAQADARMLRVMLLHVVIIFGAVAASKFESPYGMLAVMLGLKTLTDAVLAAAAGAASKTVMNSAPVHEPTELQRLEAQAERRLTREQRAQRDQSR